MSIKKLLPLLVASILCVFPHSLQAQESAPTVIQKVGLSCAAKNAVVDENRTFLMSPGQAVELSCTLTNSTKEKLTGMLLAKQNANGVVSASSMVVNLGEEATQEATLSFPASLVPGTYHYAAVLMGNDGKPLSVDVALTGRLEGKQQLSIASATLDKNVYTRGDMATLSLMLSDKGQGESFFKPGEAMLKVSMLDVEQKDCALLLNEKAVTEIMDAYQFKLSTEANCVNAIQVTLMGKDGIALDQKILALSFPEEGSIEQRVSTTQAPSGREAVVLLGGIAGIVLLSYFLWRRRRN